jgi:hypothetical protein
MPQTATNSGVYPQCKVMVQLPGKIEKESEAKKDIIKLMLLHICGDIDINSMSITNINLASPSGGTQVVLNQPCATRTGQFADPVRMTFDLAKQENYTNICSSQVYMLFTCFKKILQQSRLPALSLRQI